MIVALVASALALLLILCLWHMARGQVAPVRCVDDLLLAIRPVDVDAFRNLTDPLEEVYLRDNLAPADFRRVQRARTLTAAEYLRRTAHNAALMLRMGQFARTSDNPEIARAADRLASEAIALRVLSLAALALLYLHLLLPGAQVRVSQVLTRYMKLRERFLYLSRLQAPTLTPRVEASL